MIQKFVFLLAAAGFCNSAAAAFLDGFDGLHSPHVSSSLIFKYVAPNEINPELSKPILNNAPPGVHITVGTERAFISAGLSKLENPILVLDYNPNITVYNNINIQLLKASYNPKLSITENREHYLHLRLNATESEWVEAFPKTLSTDEVHQQYSFWKKIQEQPELKFMMNTPPLEGSLTPFKNANYLYQDELFSKVQKLAVNDQIKSFVADLGQPENLIPLFKKLHEERLNISVFDLSNAWYEQYTGPKKITHLIDALEKEKLLLDRSIFLTTHHHNQTQMYKNGKRSHTPFSMSESDFASGKFYDAYQWEYHGFTHEFLESRPAGQLIDFGSATKFRGTTLNNVVWIPQVKPEPNCIQVFMNSVFGSIKQSITH